MNLKRILLVLFLLPFYCVEAQNIKHQINSEIDILKNSISVTDQITLNRYKVFEDGKIVFSLNKNFIIVEELCSSDILINVLSENEKTKTYSLMPSQLIDSGDFTFTIAYSGSVNGQITASPSDYARGFSQTDGIISATGVYLAGSTFWIPDFNSQLYSFDLTVTLDSAYKVVSQGELISETLNGNKRVVKYSSPELQEEVYLVSAKWFVYREKSSNVSIEAFLRKKDDELANKYMDATKNYLRMYEQMLGNYPYKKFALVENFWETGYGMPSFTLLGEKVIRFPWIISSSYPHELLHNYWGNSVYVDYPSGNWCEGITSYMADHLFKEQIGEAEEYRRSTLQKYADFVNDSNDFPLSEFISRQSPAEEAIGYGKCLMMNHMLRQEFGDEVFLNAYRHFYLNNKYKRASFSDIQQSFETISRVDLDLFFEQWTKRKGAPKFTLTDVTITKEGENHVILFKLNQVQEEDLFQMTVPVAVYLEGDTNVRMQYVISDKRTVQCKYFYNKRPIKVHVDPQFDVFRLVDKREVPPSLSRMYGSNKILLVIPRNDPKYYEYEILAKQWQTNFRKEGKTADILYDKDLLTKVDYPVVWIFGYNNKFAVYNQFADKYLSTLDTATLRKFNEAKKNKELVFVYPNPDNLSQTYAFVGLHNFESTASITSKLPHYGKYSFLAFEGKNATNILKGTYEVIDSPMSYTFKFTGGTPSIMAKLPKRKALVK